MEYMYYDNRTYNDNTRYIRETLAKDNKTQILTQVGGYPTREELVAEAKEVFSGRTYLEKIYDVKRIRDNAGTTIAIQGYTIPGRLRLDRPVNRPTLDKLLEVLVPKEQLIKKSFNEFCSDIFPLIKRIK